MIFRRPDLESKLYDALRESFGDNRRGGIHLSALLSVRQTFWQYVKPLPLTDDELGYFTAGRGHEDALTRFLGTDFKATEEAEIDGIHIRPDFVAITDRIIPVGAHAEFKTRRSNLPDNDEEAQTEFSSYRNQVRGYMALKRMNEMYLIVLSLVEGKTNDVLSRSHPVFAVYCETASNLELEQEREKLQARRRGLTAAREMSPEVLVALMQGTAAPIEYLTLPLCEDWLCGKRRPEVREPATCLTCGQVFKSIEFGPDKHVKSAKGQGHEVKAAVVEWFYQARCKWYLDCQPWIIDPARGGTPDGPK